jgi:RNA polymerase sigma factor (sigma-70 family)
VTDTPDRDRERHNSLFLGVTVDGRATDMWFLREVLPLEAALIGYFRRNWRNENDVRDLVQDVYVRVYTHLSKVKECDYPHKARPFVFTTARNLLISKFRTQQVIPIETVGDLESLAVVSDEPGPDRSVTARDELRRLQCALDQLAPRCREAVVLRQVEGLSRKEIAARMGISDATVREHLAAGLFTLSDIFFGDNFDSGRPA